MDKRTQNQYSPDVVSPTGDTIKETLEALGMSQTDLAERTGRSKMMIHEIVKGKAPITPQIAIDLERVLGVPVSFWNNRERNYHRYLSKVEEERGRL
jgi:HTH-type transcriptional regulator / antitoxin HigA